jgi:hypothetical protein
MVDLYVIIPQDFATAMQGKESPVTAGSLFGYAVTNDNRYVCSVNVLTDFPDDFASVGDLMVLPLNISDFPASPPIE